MEESEFMEQSDRGSIVALMTELALVLLGAGEHACLAGP